MPIKQPYPAIDQPLVDPDTGVMSLLWSRFFLALWNRTGAAPGNDSPSFPFPNTTGNPGQVLTSQGANASIWTTVKNALSQFNNDVGFITSEALVGLQNATQTNTLIQTFFTGSLASNTPQTDTTTGSSGISLEASRADHAHPREQNPVFTTVTSGSIATGDITAANIAAATVSANNAIGVGSVSWTSGVGAPVAVRGNSSLYSRTDGAAGTRLYVSNGVGWTPVPGV